MLKPTFLTTTYCSNVETNIFNYIHAKTNVLDQIYIATMLKLKSLTTTKYIHAETSVFYHNTLQTMLKPIFVTMTSFIHAETNIFDHGTVLAC
jgi:hypothetical protein